MEYEEIEVIDRYGARWRYKRAEGYYWAWGLLAGTFDAQDHDMVEIWRTSEPDDEGECVMCFPQAACVGDVTTNTCLNFNLREVPDARVR